MALVLDASVALAWCFEDEASAMADAALEAMGKGAEGYALVPSLWRLEVANVLLVAERRHRITQAQSDRFLALLGGLPIRFDETVSTDQVVAIGRLHGLSSYDAAYLVTALKAGLPLATKDKQLRAAARKAGITLFG